MNFRSEQFRSKADRQREAELCSHYGKINLPAVEAANTVKNCKMTTKKKTETDKKTGH